MALGTVCYGNSMGRGDSARLSKLVTRGEPGYSVVVIVDHLVSFTVSHHMVAPLRMEDIFELRGRSTGGSRFRRLSSRQKKRPAPFVLRVLYASHGGSETSSTDLSFEPGHRVTGMVNIGRRRATHRGHPERLAAVVQR